MIKTKRRISDSGAGNLLFALCFVAYAFSYFGRNNFSTCINDMNSAGILTKGFDGYISSAFLVCYGVGQFVNGRLGVRLSPKIMISCGLIGSGICNLLMGSLSNQYLYLIIWGLNGYSCSMLWPSIIRTFTTWLYEHERIQAGANVSPSIPLGMLGCYLISFFALKASWRYAFIISGVLLVIGGVIWIAGMSILKEQIEIRNKAINPVTQNVSGSKAPKLTLRLFIASGLLVAAVASIFNGMLKEAVISWVPTFLQDTFGFTPSSASLVSILLPIFSVAGPYIGIYINRHFTSNEITTVGIFLSVSAICNLALFLLGSKLAILAVVLISVSQCCMWGINSQLLTYIPYHFSKLGISAAVTGTLNCTVFVGCSICTTVYGKISDAAGNWNSTVLVWTIIAVIGTALCLLSAKVWSKHQPDAAEKE